MPKREHSTSANHNKKQPEETPSSRDDANAKHDDDDHSSALPKRIKIQGVPPVTMAPAPEGQSDQQIIHNAAEPEQQPQPVVEPGQQPVEEPEQQPQPVDIVAMMNQLMKVRHTIPFEITNCKELFTPADFKRNSAPIEVLGIQWFVQATQEDTDKLFLSLHAKLPDHFIDHYCVEVRCNFTIVNSYGKNLVKNISDILSGDKTQPREDEDGDANTEPLEMEHFNTLSESHKGFIRADGSIKIWADFVINSSTLKHLQPQPVDIVEIMNHLMKVRHTIPFEITNCKELFTPADFKRNSAPIEVLGIQWFVQATQEDTNKLFLSLHAKLPDHFIDHYCVEVRCHFTTVNSYGNVSAILSGDKTQPREDEDGDANTDPEDFEALSELDKGFIRADGSIKIWADFVIESSTLNHLT